MNAYMRSFTILEINSKTSVTQRAISKSFLKAMSEVERWVDLDFLLTRPGNYAGPDFEPCPEIREFLQSDCRILCVGAGGLGCELLKDLALSGFRHIDVIDMDTIDVSNLNRQFLFRMSDVGKSKAEVAAARVNERVPGVRVTPHHSRIEEKDADFYKQFHVIVLGLDSLEARRWINSMVCSFLEFDAEGNPDPSTLKPVVDGGTEGFKGHARVIYPGVSPCFECTMWLFPPQTRFPLCTIAETPRSAAHCIEYAKLIQWQQERPAEEFDADDPEHMQWIFQKSFARAQQFGIPGVTLQHTQGVVKNIIPAIASTNAIIAAACALETLKIVSMCSKGLNNYMMYMGSSVDKGIYTHTVAHDRDPLCPACSAGIVIEVRKDATVQETLDAIQAHPKVGSMVVAPTLATGGTIIFARGIYEEDTRSNLGKKISEFVGPAGGPLTVNDKKLAAPMRAKVHLV